MSSVEEEEEEEEEEKEEEEEEEEDVSLLSSLDNYQLCLKYQQVLFIVDRTLLFFSVICLPPQQLKSH